MVLHIKNFHWDKISWLLVNTAKGNQEKNKNKKKIVPCVDYTLSFCVT